MNFASEPVLREVERVVGGNGGRLFDVVGDGVDAVRNLEARHPVVWLKQDTDPCERVVMLQSRDAPGSRRRR